MGGGTVELVVVVAASVVVASGEDDSTASWSRSCWEVLVLGRRSLCVVDGASVVVAGDHGRVATGAARSAPHALSNVSAAASAPMIRRALQRTAQ